MADRSILFSAPMVRAILAGTKTQTRRVMPARPLISTYDGRPVVQDRDGVYRAPETRYKVGDRLWVREGFMPAPEEAPPETPRPTLWNIAYAAGGFRECTAPAGYDPMLYNYERWSPSIHMPRWASRITLTVTEVRVQRLQDITEEDAIAEGVVNTGRRDGAPYSHCIIPGMPEITMEHEPSSVFAALWEHINGDGSWKANPWVAAYTFTVEPRNIDAMTAEAARCAS